jgi:hypothetical protein
VAQSQKARGPIRKRDGLGLRGRAPRLMRGSAAVERGSQLARIARLLRTDAGLFARFAGLQSADVRAVLLDLAARP